MESRTDLGQEDAGFVSNRPMSPSSPYAPGMRSSMQRKHSQQDTSYSADAMTNGDVPMQNFQEGLPPPPPVSHSWGRIERWLEDNYEELFENLGAGCTQNDLNELEHELDCSLPQDVRESIMIHDGQERGGLPTGVVFGCMLLDCEEIVQEWAQWRRTHEEYLREPHAYAAPQAPLKAFAGAASSSSSAASAPSHASTGSNWRAELNARQDSQPPNAIQKAYVHPAWIPMARDWGGNNICVDLAPASNGKWGQVILMGRDYDCKYVVARSWGAFLANLADDMATDKWFIDEDSRELKLREFPKQKDVEPPYMDILRWRADQKYGRRQSASTSQKSGKRPGQGLRINSQIKSDFGSLNGFSPYGSPSGAGNGDRTIGKGPAQSSPLSRVAEESSAEGPVTAAPIAQRPGDNKIEKLVSIDSPVVANRPSSDSADFPRTSLKALPIDAQSSQPAGAEAEAGDLVSNTSAAPGASDEMKSVQL